MKRAYTLGPGRPQSLTSSGLAQSREKFKCTVPECNVIKRSDKLFEHYRANVEFDKKGNPVTVDSEKYVELTEVKKLHTKFFQNQGYSNTKFPKCKTPASASAIPSWATSKKPKISTVSSPPPESQTSADGLDSTIKKEFTKSPPELAPNAASFGKSPNTIDSSDGAREFTTPGPSADFKSALPPPLENMEIYQKVLLNCL